MTASSPVDGARTLIVNADDFGQSPAINQGIIAAHEQGIVTSASLMVRWPAAAEAAEYAKSRSQLSIGLHLDLGEWAFRGGEWVALYEVVPGRDPAAVSAEINRQLDQFRQLLGRDPTHLDSHQHVHREQPVRSILIERGRRLGIPVRHYSRAVRYSGAFYGQTTTGEPLPDAITMDALLGLIERLGPGITELGCHPGIPGPLDSMYQQERPQELAVLCDPQMKQGLAARQVALCSFCGVRG